MPDNATNASPTPEQNNPIGSFPRESAPSLLHATGQKAEGEINQWGCGAADHFKQRASEVKEILMILARTRGTDRERDQRYSRQFQEFKGRLQGMADLQRPGADPRFVGQECQST
jgi:hypothetical protein